MYVHTLPVLIPTWSKHSSAASITSGFLRSRGKLCIPFDETYMIAYHQPLLLQWVTIDSIQSFRRKVHSFLKVQNDEWATVKQCSRNPSNTLWLAKDVCADKLTITSINLLETSLSSGMFGAKFCCMLCCIDLAGGNPPPEPVRLEDARPLLDLTRFNRSSLMTVVGPDDLESSATWAWSIETVLVDCTSNSTPFVRCPPTESWSAIASTFNQSEQAFGPWPKNQAPTLAFRPLPRLSNSQQTSWHITNYWRRTAERKSQFWIQIHVLVWLVWGKGKKANSLNWRWSSWRSTDKAHRAHPRTWQYLVFGCADQIISDFA